MASTIKKIYPTAICLALAAAGAVTAVILVLDADKPEYYRWLFVLPLLYAVLALAFRSLFREMPGNLGVTFVLGLSFVRCVISPLCMSLGDYAVTITKNIARNTPYAIALVAYELAAVFLALYIKQRRDAKKAAGRSAGPGSGAGRGDRTYAVLLGAVLAVLALCIFISPSLLRGYRSIFQAGDVKFTTFEDAYLVRRFGKTFVGKLSMVVGQYLSRYAIIAVPAFLMTLLSRKKTLLSRIAALVLCAFPLFFIGGTIARSLIYLICLLMMYNYAFFEKTANRNILLVICLAAAAVVGWWLFRGDESSRMADASQRFSAYFSGVNVVSGSFNLPYEWSYRARYLINDFIGALPFSTTIFHIDYITVQKFFNNWNAVTGQIPTTIGMSYFYLGFLAAPVYSVAFAWTASEAGERLKGTAGENPLRTMRLVLTAFQFSMGIVMYNIEITLYNFVCVLLPMYILERLAYGNWRHGRRSRKGAAQEP